MTIQERMNEVHERLDRAVEGDQVIGNLTLALAQLCEAVEQLAAVNAPQLPDECRHQECSYFAHYLVHYDPNVNGAKLDHAPYHHAEKHCESAQQRVIDWLDAHKGADPPMTMPEHLEALAAKWERRTCA